MTLPDGLGAGCIRHDGGADVRWMLDEMAHAGPEHLDAGYVESYDPKAGVDPAGESETLRRYGLGPTRPW
jgi:hypothetical protein